MDGKKLTQWILIALVAGLAVGYVLNVQLEAARAEEVAGYFTIVTNLFLRMIKMIIAPLVFAALVSGIAHMGGDAGALGRIGARTIAWFLGASLVSLSLGLVMVNTLTPGVGLDLPLPPASATAGVATADFSLAKFVEHLVPKSIFEAMANNEILQIVVFSIFAGIALAAIGEQGKPLVRGVEALMHLMLKITGYVMLFAPFAVFAAVAATIATRGIGIVATYGEFVGEFYLTLFILWAILLAAGGSVFGFGRIKELVGHIRAPLILAFSTASSEAAYPKTLEGVERFGVPKRIASFVLPLGYSFNLDGSMLYCTFATIFIAQAYGIDLTLGQEISMLLLLMVTSKGMAGVPRASLVVIAATLSFFKIPEAGLLLILAIDHFLDMGRSATNVVGNAVATAVVAKWEGTLRPAGTPDPDDVVEDEVARSPGT